MRHVENINVPLLRWGLVNRLIQANLQLAPDPPLRVVVVAPPISLTDWQASLPAELNWEAFTWHELPDEPTAETLSVRMMIPELRKRLGSLLNLILSVEQYGHKTSN